MTKLFELLQASLFMDKPVHLSDWRATFAEMRDQTVAALPGAWLMIHPVDPSWMRYCCVQQAKWARVMYAQGKVIDLLEAHNIPSVIIKGAAAAIYYPHPNLRTMGDVDVLIRRRDMDRAAEILEANGYTLTEDKDHVDHHYSYCKNEIRVELHKRPPFEDGEDEELLQLFESGIDQRVWATVMGYRFPVLPPVLNGSVLILHINHHLRDGVGLRHFIDWMMYVNQLSPAQWEELRGMLRRMGMEKLALTTTAMCQKYLGLKSGFSGCETVDPMICDELMAFILEKGNFGRKAKAEGKADASAVSSTEQEGLFHRLGI